MGLRFEKAFFFPNIETDEILELQFQLAYNMPNQEFNCNGDDYYETVWLYDRLVYQRQKENEKARQDQGMMSLADAGML